MHVSIYNCEFLCTYYQIINVINLENVIPVFGKISNLHVVNAAGMDYQIN